MADISGAVSPVARAEPRVRQAAVVARAGWVRVGPMVRGPLVTLATVIGFDLLTRAGLPVLHPFAFLLLTVVYAAGSGGVRPGLVSALLAVVYAAHFLSDARSILSYTPAHAYTLFALAVLMPAAAVLVARFRAAKPRTYDAELTREDVLEVERRLSYFAEAHVVLAASLDYEVTLRHLARITVPVLADWCAIHVLDEQGGAQFVAGAHRDPARDLLVRALCEYDTKRLPFRATATDDAALFEVDETVLRGVATDGEHLKLYRTLAPVSVIRAPMRARGRAVGMMTLAVGRGWGRQYDPDDLRAAEELASRAALAVDNARLYREAEGAEARYRMLFDGNPQPMWVFDTESLAFLSVNDAAVRHYGYAREEFLAMTIIDLRPVEELPGLLPSLEHVDSRRGEVALAQHQRKDGSVVEMELVSHEFEVGGRRARLVLATDVTERARTRAALRRSEEQLRQVQRMDAVGRLVGGVAHDFNNLLTTIRGFSDIVLQDLPPDHVHVKDVQQIRKAADRGAQLTRQLLAFGQQQALHPRPLDLNEVVGAMDALMRRLLGADIRLVTHLQSEIGRVRMDPSQLEQVLVNLVLNARDAMPAGGTLTIETAQRQITRSGRARNVRPGNYLVLAVGDTGSGMEGETLQHLFEPFFTNKPQGQRAGLGLAIVHGIVRQSGGVIRVASEPGRGTTVKIYLPRFEEAVPEVAPSAANEFVGTETVLVAEDEEGVRELLRKILTEHGHRVLEARHGRDALLVAERYQQPIHLLIADVVMPELGGAPLADQLVRQRPGLKVLYISGYTNDEIVRRGVNRADAEFVQKPFTADDLMRRVRALLDGDAATASAARVEPAQDGRELRPRGPTRAATNAATGSGSPNSEGR